MTVDVCRRPWPACPPAEKCPTPPCFVCKDAAAGGRKTGRTARAATTRRRRNASGTGGTVDYCSGWHRVRNNRLPSVPTPRADRRPSSRRLVAQCTLRPVRPSVVKFFQAERSTTRASRTAMPGPLLILLFACAGVQALPWGKPSGPGSKCGYEVTAAVRIMINGE